MRISRVFGPIALFLLAPGCREDLTPGMQEWKVVQNSHEDYEAEMRFQRTLVFQVASASGEPSLPTLQEVRLGETEVATEHGFAPKRSLVEERIRKGKLEPLKMAVVEARTAWDTLRANALTSVKDNEFAANQASHTIAEAGGKVSFYGLALDGDALAVKDLVVKRSANRFLTFAKNCPELKFNLVGHASGSDPNATPEATAKLARATKDYLVASGLAADRIPKTLGVGAKEPLVREPDAKSEGTKLNPKMLERARAMNRRVEAVVVEHCL